MRKTMKLNHQNLLKRVIRNKKVATPKSIIESINSKIEYGTKLHIHTSDMKVTIKKDEETKRIIIIPTDLSNS